MYEPLPAHFAVLREAAPGAELIVARGEAEARAAFPTADAVLGNRWFLQSLRAAAGQHRLRWMQSNSVGVDYILSAGDDLAGVTLTCARGVYDDEMAEHALALLLALVRGLPGFVDQQRTGVWRRGPLRTLRGMRGLILGWGGVGCAAAGLLAGAGARVEGARRGLPRPETDSRGFPVWTPLTWRERLPEMDFLLLALPLTAETRRLVGAAELARLREGALVVNVGRGGTLDDDALLEAVRSGRLAGAALDVLEEEPPAPGSPLWREPRILITPHVARSAETAPFRWEGLFVENLRRFCAGEPLLNVVDPARGY
jgi:phosphoglycerate dehydrogenase-like enzyme